MNSKLLIFLLINFSALGIGGFLMGEGPASSWYQNLNQAPWTPPGWVFGAAWTTIMLCFSIYMAKAYQIEEIRNQLLLLFVIQWILNVAWNPVFFNFHLPNLGIVVIVSLTLLVGYIMFTFVGQLKNYTFLIAPYFIWLLIATSLNVYISLNN